MSYLFEYAVRKCRKEGFASLAEHERWDWHGDLYGWRRVFLGASPDEKTSPCDLEGKWFDAARAKLAEDHYRNSKRRQRNTNDDVFDARDIENRWAQQRGYNDFEHYKGVEGLDHVEACVRVIKSFIAAMPQMPGKDDDYHAAAAALGVTAREVSAEAAE